LYPQGYVKFFVSAVVVAVDLVEMIMRAAAVGVAFFTMIN
jgi:hypothetical protein